VSECDREAVVMRRHWPTRSSSAMKKKREMFIGSVLGYTITQISIQFVCIRSVTTVT
jgi:hypothetical protein